MGTFLGSLQMFEWLEPAIRSAIALQHLLDDRIVLVAFDCFIGNAHIHDQILQNLVMCHFARVRLWLVGIWHRCSLLADATLPQGFYLANTPTVYVLLGSQMSQESRPASYVPWIWAFTSAMP